MERDANGDRRESGVAADLRLVSRLLSLLREDPKAVAGALLGVVVAEPDVIAAAAGTVDEWGGVTWTSSVPDIPARTAGNEDLLRPLEPGRIHALLPRDPTLAALPLPEAPLTYLITYQNHGELAAALCFTGRVSSAARARLDMLGQCLALVRPYSPPRRGHLKGELSSSFVENIRDYAIFMVDPAGRVTEWTEGARNVLGYTAEEALGRNFAIFFTPDDTASGEPQRELQQALAEGRAERESWRMHRSGRRIWVNAISTPVFDAKGELIGFTKIGRDLTDRKRAEEERERLEARLANELKDMQHLHEISMRLVQAPQFQQMLEEILDSTIALQQADLGNVQLYDEAAEQFVIVAQRGFSPEFLERYGTVAAKNNSASGQAFRSAQRVVIADVAREISDTLLSEAARAADFRALQCTPILARGGRVIGMLSTCFRDSHAPSERELRLTDIYMRLASELITRTRDQEELRRAHLEADQANQAKSRFLATASHDLRQPLQALSLLNRAAQKLAQTAGLADTLAQQGQAISTMSSLLDALLDISTLESGAVKPMLQGFDIAELIEEVRVEFDGLARNKGLALHIDVPSVSVYSDPTLIGQIVRNLVSNAIRYTLRGSINVHARPHDGSLVLAVEDTGIGIAAEVLPHIFEEFFQVGVAPNAQREGRGLGLNIVQRTARLLHHPLSVRSQPGVGSAFLLELPLGEPTNARRASRVKEVASGVEASPSTHALIIEDDPSVLRATRLLLELEGLRVSSATNTAEAMACARAHADIGLLISDYHLREGEVGTGAIKAVREILGEAVGAIILTGDTSRTLKMLSADPSIRVASKPVDAEQLMRLVHSMIAELPSSH